MEGMEGNAGVPRMARGLGYAGLLPFIAAALLVLLPGGHAAAVAGGVLLYALVIVSFLGGAVVGYRPAAAAPRDTARQ